MKLVKIILSLSLAAVKVAPAAAAFSAPLHRGASSAARGSAQRLHERIVDVDVDAAPATSATRADFLSASLTSAAALLALASPGPASARGRATLEQAYDRYTPRIVAGGKFYSGDLLKSIERNDWNAIKAATSDPPKKTKADRAKIDGGVSERAAQAGEFSDAKVLVAADLFASSFSDNSISPKTKTMRSKVEELRKVVEGINQAAREALGEESSSGGGGGFFGIGAKKPSQAELAATVRKLYVQGGNAYNQYVFAANEELPLSLAKLPYL